jgi:four helix bundle protein
MVEEFGDTVQLFNLSTIFSTILCKFDCLRCINLKTSTMYTFSFEKLDVWNRSRQLTKCIYKITKKFPDEEKFGIISQLRRASISVCSNIAEGSSRKSKKDQIHFYNIAYSSLMETLNQLIISNDLEFIDCQSLSDTRKEIHTISRMINGLSNSLGKS